MKLSINGPHAMLNNGSVTRFVRSFGDTPKPECRLKLRWFLPLNS
jgi:hypothetical protein